MSISSELLTLNNTKTAIRTAINNKGGSVEASAPFASYATAIDNLPSGGDNSTLIDLIERDITSITIPSGTTKIGSNAFSNISTLTSVTIPNTVTSIGQNAFSNTGLTSVTIPNSVTQFGTYTFYNCSSLTSCVLPNTLTTIPQSCFFGTGLTNISFPSSVTTIENHAFKNSRLVTLTIPDTLTILYGSAFEACSSLKKVVIGTGVTNMNNAVFYNCTSLESVVIKATNPPTQTNAFVDTNNCPIYVPSASVDTYKAASGWSTFASRIVAIEDAILLTPTNGDPAISVKNYELASTGYIQSTDVPSTIKNGAGALEIGGGVTRIGTFTFQNGSSLTSVVIPDTVTRIDEAAFNGCSSLTSITVNAATPPTLYAAAFDSTNNCPIYVPASSVDTYKAASGWSTYASRIVAIPTPTPTSSNYVKVSSINDITDGKYLVVWEDANTPYALNGALADDSGHTHGIDATNNFITVTISNGEIESDTAINAAALDFNLSDGTLQTSNGYYLYYTSSSYLEVSTVLPEDYYKVIPTQEPDELTYSFGTEKDATKIIGFNTTSQSMRFRYLSASTNSYYTNIALYKLNEQS